jgi:4-oxalomesaconate tautomerase
MWMRGGTSKGAYLLANDMPKDPMLRDAVLRAVMGSPDPRQIDGMGGAHPLTSKVAIVSPSSRADCDVDYLFLQVTPDSEEVSTAQNCGNILAGVGPFAIERGLVAPTGDATRVRVHMLNSDSRAELLVRTPGGLVDYEGEARIDGVPGTHAPVVQNLLDTAGAQCGSLLPTGRTVDTIEGVDCTLIDNGMPTVVMRADAFDLVGDESPAKLEANETLKAHLERIRLTAGPMMNLGDIRALTVPKLILVAPPQAGGFVMTRSFIPHRVHTSIGVLAALSVATACLLTGTPGSEVAVPPAGSRVGDTVKGRFGIEHPTGILDVEIELTWSGERPEVRRAAILRTARKLFDGEVFIPREVWPDVAAAE